MKYQKIIKLVAWGYAPSGCALL